jgi:hypothetical protein
VAHWPHKPVFAPPISVGSLLASFPMKTTMKPADMEVIPHGAIAVCIILTLAFGIACLCASTIIKPSMSAGGHLSFTYSNMRSDAVLAPEPAKAIAGR